MPAQAVLFTGDLHMHPMVLIAAAKTGMPVEQVAYRVLLFGVWFLGNARGEESFAFPGLELLATVFPGSTPEFWQAAKQAGLIEFDPETNHLSLAPDLIVPGEEIGPIYG